jgi:hypothetical protein
MFLSIKDANSGMDSLNESIKLADVNFVKLGQTIRESLDPITTINKAFEIQQLNAKAVRSTMGLTVNISKELDKVMANVTLSTLEFGVGVDENIKLFSTLNTQMLRNTFLTEEQTINMQAFAKAANLSAEEVSTMVVSFDNIGIGIEGALERMTKMRQTAISFGVNVNEMMKVVAKNVGLLTAFNFKNGIDGFTRMVAKAQALRIDFSKTINLADSLMDPEKTIELAAGMQMLGGSVGDLADPFRVLYLAQNDVEGLQDELLKASQSAVVFNQKTGDFNIPVTEMYRLREMAKLTGKSYQELADEAVKAASRTKKLEMLDLTSIPEEYREMVANLSRIEGGELKINLPGEEDSIEVSKLTFEQLKKIQELDEISSMTDKDIAIKQLTAIEAMATAIERTGFLTTRAAILDPSFENSIENMLDQFNQGLSTVNSTLEKSSQGYIEGLNTFINSMYPEDVFEKGSEKIVKTMDDLSKEITKLITEFQTFPTKFIVTKETPVNELNDFISTPTTKRTLTSPEGTFKINNNDLIIGGTNLFDDNESTKTTNSLESFFIKQLDVLKQTTNLISNNKQQVVDVRLSMEGDIDLSLNNLPINNMSQDMLVSLMNNPEFKNKILQIVNNSNNFYS